MQEYYINGPPPSFYFDLPNSSDSVGCTQIELFAVAFGPGLAMQPARPRFTELSLRMSRFVGLVGRKSVPSVAT
jgi:hypothetical protein